MSLEQGSKEGKLFSARLSEEGPSEPQELYDFNPLSFEALKAPY